MARIGVLAEAGRLIERADLAAALSLLQANIDGDDAAEAHGLRGLAQYLSEDYPGAVASYAAALAEEPDNAAWAETLVRARANVEAEITTSVPEIAYLDAAALLAPPAVAEDALPMPLPPREATALEKARKLGGDAFGFAASFIVDAVTQIAGRGGGYKDDVWTNWYRKRLTVGILTLGYMRTLLNKNNLYNTYPKKACTDGGHR